MRVVIAGAGRAGSTVALRLRGAGHEVVLVDVDEGAAKRAFERHGLVVLVGDATDPTTLDDAGVGQADVVVAFLQRDADNLAVLSLARRAGARRVMARARAPRYVPLLVAAGAERVLSEVETFAEGLAASVEHEAVRHAMVLADGGSIAFEIELPKGAWVDGRSVGELAADPRFPSTCVLAGVYDPGGAFRAPRGASVLRGGERLLLVAARSDLPAVVRLFTEGGAT